MLKCSPSVWEIIPKWYTVPGFRPDTSQVNLLLWVWIWEQLVIWDPVSRLIRVKIQKCPADPNSITDEFELMMASVWLTTHLTCFSVVSRWKKLKQSGKEVKWTVWNAKLHLLLDKPVHISLWEWESKQPTSRNVSMTTSRYQSWRTCDFWHYFPIKSMYTP